MSGFIPVNTYWYTHLGLLAFGFWAIVDKKSIDAIIMVMTFHLIILRVGFKF